MELKANKDFLHSPISFDFISRGSGCRSGMWCFSRLAKVKWSLKYLGR